VKLLIRIRNLSFSYGGSPGFSAPPVLDGVSFGLHAGERLAVLGANGSGKSTLLGCISGLLAPQGGGGEPPVLFYGREGRALCPDNGADLERIRRLIAVVLQNPDDQIIGSSAAEDAAFGPENLGLHGAELGERVRRALEKCGLKKLQGRSSRVLSGGEKQRLALAGALAMDPSILVLDEAASMLDRRGREDFLALLDILSAEGKTIIQVTHSLEEALRCGRCLVLYRGRLVFDGGPAELLEKPELEDWGFILPGPLRAVRLLAGRFPGFSAAGLGPEETADRLTAWLKRNPPEDPAPGEAASSESGGAGGDENSAAAPVKAAVSFINVSHRYAGPGPAAGISGVNLNIRRGSGEIIALVGQNGSGKSTILRHINALLLPTEGRVLVFGKDTLSRKTSLASLRMNASLSVQNPESALFEPYVADDVAFGPKNGGLAGQDLIRRVRDAMEQAGLPFDEFADRETRTLSGGEKRRAAIAGSAAMESDLLLLDEPLAALDGFHQAKILALIRNLRRAGKTVVVSTHSMETAALADQVAVMAGGTLAAFGPPREIFGPRWDERWGLMLPWTAAAARRLAGAGFASPFSVPLNAEELLNCIGAEGPRRREVQNPRGGSSWSGETPPETEGGFPPPGPRRPRRKTGLEFFRRLPPDFFADPSSPVLRNMGSGLKLLLFFLVAALALAGPQPFSPLGALILTLAAGRIAAGIGPLRLLRGFVFLGPWMLILGMLQLAYAGPPFDFLRPLSLLCRAAALMALVSFFSAALPLGEFLRTVNRGLAFLGRFGFPARDLSLTAGITFRFIPILAEEAGRIAEAQLSRGGKKGRLSIAFSLVIPLFLRALERAGTLGKAMLLRGYGQRPAKRA
jgi:energy-coupling factor transport system ATP-binding protein